MNKPNFNNFIQVAGVIDKPEAEMLINCGVHYLGFPLRLPVNKEDLTENEAAEIIKTLLPPVYGVVISYSSTAKEAIELCDKLNAKIIQLHGPIEPDELRKLKNLRSDILVIKSLVIKENNTEELIKTITKTESYVEAYITDTFNPATGASGATGKTHNWEISKHFVELSTKPVILAGGLNADNVYEAILKVKPAGVDVHTGVENKSGRKDERLVKKFVTETKRAFYDLNKLYYKT